MADHIGIGLVEQLLVDTMFELGATPDGDFVTSSRILAGLRDRHGVHLDQGYEALVTLSASWLAPACLVSGYGNFGSPSYGPANPRYTEARLSRAGALVARGAGTPQLPVGLVHGDLHHAGTRPAFAPGAVIDAVALAAREPGCTDQDLLAVVGGPVAATGSTVDGDLAALVGGRPTRLTYAATITIEPGPRLLLSNLPPGTGASDVMSTLYGRGSRPPIPGHPDLEDELYLPIADLSDETIDGPERIAVTPKHDADPEELRSQLFDIWPVAVEVDAHLPAPLPDLVRAAVDPDRDGQLAALEALRSSLGA